MPCCAVCVSVDLAQSELWWNAFVITTATDFTLMNAEMCIIERDDIVKIFFYEMQKSFVVLSLIVS